MEDKCTTHECYVGSENIPGCPMFQHLPFVDNNLACKFCFNCIRNCPNGLVQLNLRVPAREVWHLVRVNQGFALFIGVTLAILVPLYYFEAVRSVWPVSAWRLWFNLTYWGTAISAGLITWFIAKPFKTKATSRRVKLVFAFVPLVLAGHIVYQMHHITGANSILLGLAFKTPTRINQMFYVSAFELGATITISIGLLLTIFVFIMVLLRTKKISKKINKLYKETIV